MSPLRHSDVSLPTRFKFELGQIWPRFAMLINEATRIPDDIVTKVLTPWPPPSNGGAHREGEP